VSNANSKISNAELFKSLMHRSDELDYTIHCDGSDCEESIPGKSTELMTKLVAAEAKWSLDIPSRKFSGYAHYNYCPKCRKNLLKLLDSR
jgi:hypothetical protein